MKILLDECVPMVIHEYLHKKGYEVVHVKNTMLAGLSNSVLYKKAQGEFKLFITTDRHFAHPEKFKPNENFGVIYLRVAPTIGPLLVQALENFLTQADLKMVVGKVVIVRRNDHTFR